MPVHILNPQPDLQDNAYILSLSNEEVVALCRSAPIVYTTLNGSEVLRISQGIVVKTGPAVRPREYDTMTCVAQTFKSSTHFRVPRVYRFFKVTIRFFDTGYLLMEHTPGTSLVDFPAEDVAPRVVAALHEMQETTSPTPSTPTHRKTMGLSLGRREDGD